MRNLIKLLVVFGCFLTVLGVDDVLVYENGIRKDGDELVFVQYKTSPKFHVPQDYDFEIFFDGQGNTTELTRKEIWSKTAEYKDMTITNQKNFFKVRIEKKNVRHLNGTVKIYGIRIKPEELVKESVSTASAMGSSLVLLTLFNIYRLFV